MTSRPSTSTRPFVGRWSPAIARRIVDLPAPLGPTSDSRSPGATSSEMSSTIGCASITTSISLQRQPHRALRLDERALRRECDGCDERHEHDAERHRAADVVRPGPTQEAEDRDGHGRPVGTGDEHGRAELTERDGEREPRRDGERPREERQIDLATDPSRCRAEHGCRLAKPNVAPLGEPGRGSGRRTAAPRATARAARSRATSGSRTAGRRRRAGTRIRASQPTHRAGASALRRGSARPRRPRLRPGSRQ